jgi:hypothetical protein
LLWTCLPLPAVTLDGLWPTLSCLHVAMFCIYPDICCQSSHDPTLSCLVLICFALSLPVLALPFPYPALPCCAPHYFFLSFLGFPCVATPLVALSCFPSLSFPRLALRCRIVL